MKYEELNLTDEQLWIRSLIKSTKERHCFICGAETKYIDYCSEAGICSEECMDEQNKMLAKFKI